MKSGDSILILVTVVFAIAISPDWIAGRQSESFGKNGLKKKQLENGKEPRTEDWDKKLLREAGIAADEIGLVDYLKKKTPPDFNPAKFKALSVQLGSKTFAEREGAKKELTLFGPPCIPHLVTLLRNPDLEIAKRARTCIDSILGQWDLKNVLLYGAAIRLGTRLQSERAVEELLRAVPFVKDQLEEQVWFGLDALVIRRRKLDATVLGLARDTEPLRRAAAAYLICRRGTEKQRQTGLKFLKDPAAVVRLRAAQGLLGAGNKSSIPALISLLHQTPVTVAWQAEELLQWAAGENAPTVFVSGGGEQAKKCKAAWEDWWSRIGKNLNVTSLSEEARRPGLIYVRSYQELPSEGYLCGYDGTPRWRFSSGSNRGKERELLDPYLFQFLENDQVLVCFIKNRRYALLDPERVNPKWNASLLVCDLRGNAVSSFPLNSPMRPTRCIRFLNGQMALLFLKRNQGLILDMERSNLVGPHGRNTPLPNLTKWETAFTRRFKDGKQLELRGREWVELTSTGKPVWSREGASVQYLPNGHKLVLNRRLFEVDQEGRMVLEIPILPEYHYIDPVFCLIRLGLDDVLPPDSALPNSLTSRIKGLRSARPNFRYLAAQGIRELGRKALSALPGLLEALGNELLSGSTGNSPWTLIRIVEDTVLDLGKEALPVVINGCKDSNSKIRAASFSVAGPLYKSLGSAAEAQIWPLFPPGWKDPSPLVRFWALYCSAYFENRGAERLPMLIRALKDMELPCEDHEPIAYWAANALGGLGPAARSGIPALIEATESKNAFVRCEAAFSLANISVGDRSATEKILPILISIAKEDKSWRACWGALRGLIRLGPEARRSIPLLIDILEGPKKRSPTERMTAIDVISAIGPEASKALPALIRILDNSPNRDERVRAIFAIVAMGNKAKTAIPALKRASKDEDPGVRQCADEALKKILQCDDN